MTAYSTTNHENYDLFMKTQWELRSFHEKVVKMIAFSQQSNDKDNFFTNSWKWRLYSRTVRENNDCSQKIVKNIICSWKMQWELWPFHKKSHANDCFFIHEKTMKKNTFSQATPGNNDLFTKQSWKRRLFMKKSWTRKAVSR